MRAIGFAGFLFASMVAIAAPPGTLSPRSLQDALKDLQKRVGKPKVRREHPDYPVYQLLLALKADLNGKPKAVIRIIEPVLPEVKYDGLAEKLSSNSMKLSVGTIGSYDLWRGLGYTLLGRAYYETQEPRKALFYFQSVAKDSPFYPIAVLGRVWALFELGDSEALGQVGRSLDELEELRLTDNQKREARLEQAYYASVRGKAEEAADIAEDVNFGDGTFRRLQSIKWKIVAQSRFEIYFKGKDSNSDSKKVAQLQRISGAIEKVHPNDRDAALAYLAGETYWHLASVYRVQDPEGLRAKWMAALAQGDKWLAPWIQKSIREKTPHLTEEGFFLSVATLWEASRFKEALPRLDVIPRFFPQGVYRQDSYQLLADYFYDRANFPKALYYYQKLAEVGNPEKAAYGVYKAAWSFYNQQKKWAALRHLERLLLHYRERGEDKKNVPGSLAKEVRQDMLLMLAELNRYNGALKELEVFKYQGDEKIEVREKLALVFEKIGKFEDSIAIWRLLLRSANDTDRSFEWMHSLLKTLLAAGKRRLMAKALNEYIKRLPDNSSKHAELQKKVVNLLLTVHKEARKTDDRDIWRATDELYNAFIANYPNTNEGHIWYYGAQRKESLGKLWQSIGWYQKAAEVEGYENAADSGLSVLKLLRDQSDKLSLKKRPPLKQYQRIAETAKWYTAQFPKQKQKKVAEYLILEGYYNSRDYKLAREYLAKAFKEDGPTKDHQDQYFTQNRRYYKAENWPEAYQLSNEVIVNSDVRDDKEFAKKILKIRQESAFQSAYRFEQIKKVSKAREWYRKATDKPVDFEIAIKAWHNLLLTYSFPKEVDPFSKVLAEFEERFNVPEKLSLASRKLMFSIYNHASKAYDSIWDPVKSSDALVGGLQFFPDHPNRENIYWESLVSYGSYYQLNKMKREMNRLIKLGLPIVKKENNRAAIARLFFWNGDYESSWKILKTLAQGKASTSVWLLLRDLYITTKDENASVRRNIQSFLVKEWKRLRVVGVLQPLWARVLQPDFDERKLSEWKVPKNRKPASRSNNAPAHIQLKERLGMVAQTLKDLTFNKNYIQKHYDTGAPQVTLAALCASPKIEKEAIARLGKLKRPVIKSSQWKAFVQRIDAKIKELKKVARQEEKSCEVQKKQIVYMPPLVKVPSALCDQENCFPEIPDSVDDVLGLGRKWLKSETKTRKVQRITKVKQYLEMGAWASAELVAYSSESVKERSFLLGLIRVGMNDPWNAAPLLLEAEKSKSFAHHAGLLLARSAWRHGHRKVARKEAKKVRRKRLLSWEKPLFDSMIRDLRPRRKPASRSRSRSR